MKNLSQELYFFAIILGVQEKVSSSALLLLDDLWRNLQNFYLSYK